MFSEGDVAAINKLYKCGKDQYVDELPEVLSDEEVEERRDERELGHSVGLDEWFCLPE